MFVKRAEKKERKSAGGIIMVENPAEEKKPNYGVVLAVSPKDDKGITPTVKVGDTVYFNEFAGLENEFEHVQFLTMKEYDIFGIYV